MPAPDTTSNTDDATIHPALIHAGFILFTTGLYTAINAAGYPVGESIGQALLTNYKVLSKDDGLNPTITGSALVLFIFFTSMSLIHAHQKSTALKVQDALSLIPVAGGANWVLAPLATGLSATFLYDKDLVHTAWPAAYTSFLGTTAISIPLAIAFCFASIFYKCCKEPDEVIQTNTTPDHEEHEPTATATPSTPAPQVVIIPVTPTDFFQGQSNTRNLPRITFHQDAESNTDEPPNAVAVQVSTP